MELLLTILIGFAGAYLALRYKVPAGAMVGSLLAVMVFNILFDTAVMPQGLKFYTQAATGAYVGAKISREDVTNLRHIVNPAMILSVVMLCFTVAVGLVICRMSDLTVATALFSMAPAGIADMTLASMDFDAQPSVVALIQTLRVIFVVLLMPFIIRCLAEKQHISANQKEAGEDTAKKRSVLDLFVTAVIGLAFGALGKWMKVPGGAIAFSMLACAGYNIRFEKGFMPLRVRKFVQVFAGSLIGTTVGRSEFYQMLKLSDVVLVAVLSFVVLDLVAGFLIARWTDMDIISALFSCAPGGLTDMTLIASEMGADGVKVAGMHMFRLVSVVALYPSVIELLVSFV